MEAAQAERELPDCFARDISAILPRQIDVAGREQELEEQVEKVTLYVMSFPPSAGGPADLREIPVFGAARRFPGTLTHP